MGIMSPLCHAIKSIHPLQTIQKPRRQPSTTHHNNQPILHHRHHQLLLPPKSATTHGKREEPASTYLSCGEQENDGNGRQRNRRQSGNAKRPMAQRTARQATKRPRPDESTARRWGQGKQRQTNRPKAQERQRRTRKKRRPQDFYGHGDHGRKTGRPMQGTKKPGRNDRNQWCQQDHGWRGRTPITEPTARKKRQRPTTTSGPKKTASRGQDHHRPTEKTADQEAAQENGGHEPGTPTATTAPAEDATADDPRQEGTPAKEE